MSIFIDAHGMIALRLARNHGMPSRIIFSLGLAGFVIAGKLAAADLAPGTYTQLKATAKTVSATYDLYLPKVYATTTARLPVVFVYKSYSGIHLKAFTAWAEENEVVTVAIDRFSSGAPEKSIPQLNAVLATVMTTYRVEPKLRFMYESSGFLLDNATDAKIDWAGYVSHQYSLHRPILKTTCIGVVTPPAENDTYTNSFYWIRLRGAQEWGNPIQATPTPASSDSWNPLTDAKNLLTWMISWQLFTQSSLPNDQRIRAQNWLKERMRTLQAEPNLLIKHQTAQSFLWSNPILRLPETKDLPELWVASGLALAEKETDPRQRARRIFDLNTSERSKSLTGPVRKQLSTEFSELSKNPDLKIDLESRAALDELRNKIGDLQMGKIPGDGQKNLRGVIQQCEAFIKRWPATDAAAAATIWITALEKSLQ